MLSNKKRSDCQSKLSIVDEVQYSIAFKYSRYTVLSLPNHTQHSDVAIELKTMELPTSVDFLVVNAGSQFLKALRQNQGGSHRT